MITQSFTIRHMSHEVLVQKLRFRSSFCSKIAFSLEVLLKKYVFACAIDQKLRFRSRFCSKNAFSLEVLFKNCVFARGFAENCSKSASWEYFGRGSWPWAKIASNQLPGSILAEVPGPGPKLLKIGLLGALWLRLLALCQNCSESTSWDLFNNMPSHHHYCYHTIIVVNMAW